MAFSTQDNWEIVKSFCVPKDENSLWFSQDQPAAPWLENCYKYMSLSPEKWQAAQVVEQNTLEAIKTLAKQQPSAVIPIEDAVQAICNGLVPTVKQELEDGAVTEQMLEMLVDKNIIDVIVINGLKQYRPSETFAFNTINSAGQINTVLWPVRAEVQKVREKYMPTLTMRDVLHKVSPDNRLDYAELQQQLGQEGPSKAIADALTYYENVYDKYIPIEATSHNKQYLATSMAEAAATIKNGGIPFIYAPHAEIDLGKPLPASLVSELQKQGVVSKDEQKMSLCPIHFYIYDPRAIGRCNSAVSWQPNTSLDSVNQKIKADGDALLEQLQQEFEGSPMFVDDEAIERDSYERPRG